MTYDEFLKGKIEIANESGFEIDRSCLNDGLKPHQKDIVQWAIKGGKRAVFASFGSGKTSIQLEFCYQVVKEKGGKALIICPLGVKQEFSHDATTILGYEPPTYVKTMEECKSTDNSILITNYERVRDGDIDPTYFTVTSLDEAAVLRDFGSKTYQTFLEKFKGVPYKIVATATPSPNKLKELIHYAGYLEIADTGHLLTRYFQRDSTKANNLTLYPNMAEDFWLFVSTWAVFMEKPSDLCPEYSDDGYDLPEINMEWDELPIEYGKAVDKDGQYSLFENAALGLQQAAHVKSQSKEDRLDEVMKLLNDHGVTKDSGKQAIVWINLNAEQEYLEKALKKEGITYSSIWGNQSIEKKEALMDSWKESRSQVLLTKPEMYASGVNLQQCNLMIFAGINYKFEEFIQALHRVYRFGQKNVVYAYVIYMESERTIKETLLHKWTQHNDMVKKMTDLVREYGLNDIRRFDRLKRKMGVETVRVEGNHYTAVNDDCVAETKKMETNSVDLICTSIPFGTHYEYSENYMDFGFNEDDNDFFKQMDYLTPELLRVLKPGRVAAIHVKDRILFGNATGDGFPTVEPFHADTITHFMKHGFRFFGMITICRDVVRENNQTYRLGWTEQCKDGSKMGVGCPEYILLFRKLPTDTTKAYADEPVVKSKQEYTRAQWQIDAHAFWRESGDRPISKEELVNIPVKDLQRVYREFSRNNVYDYKEHVELAKKLDEKGKLPAVFMVVAPGAWNREWIWDDIVYMQTLNTQQSNRRKQLHVCPLPFSIVERIINRYSNEGEFVYDPFGGLGTTPMIAIKNGRYGYMCELNPNYYRDALGYLEAADNEVDSPTLFDFLEMKNE